MRSLVKARRESVRRCARRSSHYAWPVRLTSSRAWAWAYRIFGCQVYVYLLRNRRRFHS
jgi:hypothetical protein